MDKQTRNAIDNATQRARKLLAEDFAAQLEGDFDVLRSGEVPAVAGSHLTPRQVFQREKIVATLNHKCAAGMTAAEAVADYIRDAAFTTLNRFAALKMLEARKLVQECVSKGEASAGYREFCGFAPSLPLLPLGAGYRLYIESVFDELSTEVKVLFDRRDPASVLWPRRVAFEELLGILNAPGLAGIWGKDETIGWFYQYFNSRDERREMRESQAPRNSRELAVRNQFFTPRYIVQLLTDNTLGRIWYEMREAKTALADLCEYMVRVPGEEFIPRAKKDPRDIRVLDPACGSGHFLLYAFDLLITMYEEAQADPESPESEATGRTLAEDYPSPDELRQAIPGLVLAHNLYGVDIDPRCLQIAQLSVWMRAQRAHQKFGHARNTRPLKRRSNLILAEPLIADGRVSKEFMSTLSDPVVRNVFSGLLEALDYAGELGLLLQLEWIVAGKPEPGYSTDLLAPSIESIRRALAGFASQAAVGAPDTHKRLFLDDVVNGVGLMEAAHTTYDVVLTNPPFGAITDRGAAFLESADCGNLYTAFVRRAIGLAAEAVGCITDRTFLTQATFTSFRHQILSGEVSLHLLCDLGWGVLDANVQTAAYVLVSKPKTVGCLDAREIDEKAAIIGRGGEWKWIQATSFLGLPDSLLAYALPGRVLERVAEWPSLSELASLPRGLGSNKAFRTYLAWVEVPQTAGKVRRWEPLANGGPFSPWWREDRGVADWRMPDGRPWTSMGRYDSWRPYDQSGDADYFKPGLSFPKQSASFNVAILPEGFLPTREGKAILPDNRNHSWYLLAYLNSGVVRAFVRDTCGLHKQSGSIGRIPLPDFSNQEKARLARIAQMIATDVRSSYTLDETSVSFMGPSQLIDNNNGRRLGDAELRALLSELDEIVSRRFGFTPEDCRWAEEAAEPAYYVPNDYDLVSWAVGVAFGRFTNEIPKVGSLLVDPAPATPLRSPAMIIQSVTRPQDRGIFVYDPGHSADLAVTVTQIISVALSHVEAETMGSYSSDSLNELLKNRFFELHLARYTMARRKAPIYWQLATPSTSYSVWLYIHAFTRDTLFRVQNDYVAPKLEHERRRLETMLREFGERATAAERRVLAAQEAFVGELRDFLDEVKRVAPLWNPDLDDGVIINFAPLWRLVPQHKPWQRELKTTWDALCEGKYDWAHLAMRLWPERVIPKCAADRSLAIAHDLEEVFWVQGEDGKWAARPAPAVPVDGLVQERTSTAVKSALRSLLNAPVTNGRGRRRRSTGNGGGR